MSCNGDARTRVVIKWDGLQDTQAAESEARELLAAAAADKAQIQDELSQVCPGHVFLDSLHCLPYQLPHTDLASVEISTSSKASNV